MNINPKITEIFSSIQGEGILIGKRQIFIRFSGCNINCTYCDTKENISSDKGKEYTPEELNKHIKSLITPDFHSLEITGGEPLLHADYIREFLIKYPYKAMLETNATLPEKLEKLVNIIDIVSMDIKLPEHFQTEKEWQTVYKNELKSIEIMEKHRQKYYIKIVVSQKTPPQLIRDIMEDLKTRTSHDTEIIIQPQSPIEKWTNLDNLFTISEIVGENYPVSIIPQIHKYLGVA
ncbi:MAG: 7-carboxy-7-deazaguanine synthase QueE [Methanosphaera stadtmanae]|nr:7-carboxy-7-deazaguanine synthase QueE [Methanosphaera stadtmanae]